MEAGIAGVAIKHWIFIVAFSAETYFTVGFKQAFQFLETSVFGLELPLSADLLYHRHLQCLLQHLFSFVGMAAFEADHNFSHPQLSPQRLDFLRVHLLLPGPSFHAS
jgi:hypothetical protein